MKSLYLLCAIISYLPHASASNIDAIIKNKRALKELSQERKVEAYDTLSKAVVDNPQEAALSYNMGHVFEATEDKEKALQSYVASAKVAEDSKLKFSALYNAGRIAGDLKKRDEALRLYQEALTYQPDSIETKTNIELLMKNSGGGGGGSDSQEKKEDQDKGKEKKPEPNDNSDRKEEPKTKPTPRPFQSKELNQQDVKKILDELKRQEEGVRAKFNDKYRKETPVEKDW